jgi:hypothetical protein
VSLLDTSYAAEFKGEDLEVLSGRATDYEKRLEVLISQEDATDIDYKNAADALHDYGDIVSDAAEKLAAYKKAVRWYQGQLEIAEKDAQINDYEPAAAAAEKAGDYEHAREWRKAVLPIYEVVLMYPGIVVADYEEALNASCRYGDIAFELAERVAAYRQGLLWAETSFAKEGVAARRSDSLKEVQALYIKCLSILPLLEQERFRGRAKEMEEELKKRAKLVQETR